MIGRNFILALVVALSPAVRASDMSSLRLGDTASTDLVAPVALDVPDPVATAARQSVETAKVPVYFRDFPQSANNAVVQDFNAAFARALKSFSTAVGEKFSTPLDDAKIHGAEFTNFLAAYNRQHSGFPPNFNLAAEWAHGGSGAEIQAQLRARLLAMMRRPVCDDAATNGLVLGEKICLVRVTQAEDTPTAGQSGKGKFITATNVTGLARLRVLFRHSFPKEDGNFATALGMFLRPVCAPDLALTQQARNAMAGAIRVNTHFEPGQTIIRRGETVDAKSLAAIEQLRVKNLLPQTVATVSVAAVAPAAPAVPRDETLLWIAVGAAGAVSLLAIFFALRAAINRPAIPSSAGTVLQPQVSQALRDALIQELAATRVELLKSQQFASARIITANAHEKTGTNNDARPVKTLAGILAEGQALADAGEFEKALKCFDAALALQPENTDTLVKMGGALDKLGRTDEAFACFDRAIAADDSQTVAYLLKGGLFNRLARHEEAARCYEQALLKQKKSAA